MMYESGVMWAFTVYNRERTVRVRTDTIRCEYSGIHNGRYRYEYSCIVVSQPLILLDQEGRLENAALCNGWHSPSKAKMQTMCDKTTCSLCQF